jgi:hypothetical protein
MVTPPTANRVPRIAGTLAVVGMIVVIGAFYLWRYGTHRDLTPIGYDTPQYIWRANLVHLGGLSALVGWAPEGLKVHGDRTGFLVFSALVRGSTGIGAYRLMFVFPAIAAVVTALAAGALAVSVLEERWWAFAVYGIVVGLSTNMVRIAVGSHDNSFSMGMLTAFAVTALLSTASRPARVASVVLLVGAAMSHWVFAALFVALFAVVLISLLPGSWRQWRAGAPVTATPSGRLATVLGASTLAGAAALALMPQAPSVEAYLDPSMREGRLETKSARRGRELRLAWFLPAAVVGVIAGWTSRSPLRRWGILTATVWALSIVPGFVAYAWLDLEVPVYRIAAFALGIPILVAAGGVGLAMWGSRRFGLAGTVAGGVVVALLVSGVVLAGRAVWNDERPLMTEESVAAFSAVSAYLDRADIERPVVFLASERRLVPVLRQVYAGVPPRLITRTRVFVGALEDLVAGQATTRPAALAEASSLSLPGALEIADQDPLIVHVGEVNPVLPPPRAARSVSPGVSVVGGPPLVVEASVPRVGWGSLIAMTAAGLLLLILLGAGWSWSLVPADWLARLGLAPAMGAAVAVLVGTIADRAGVGFDGPAAVWMLVGTAVSGWAPAVARAMGDRRQHAGSRA